MDIATVMQQAKQMQEQMQKRMAEMRVEASAGGGMVTVVVNGTKQLQSLRIDPEVVAREDVEMLQDLILAAINDAHRKVDEQLGQSMSGMLGGLKIPDSFETLDVKSQLPRNQLPSIFADRVGSWELESRIAIGS